MSHSPSDLDPQPVISKVKSNGEVMALDYKEGRIEMQPCKDAADRDCVRVKLVHKETGNSFTLGFTMNGLSAFVILAEQILNKK